MTTVADTPCYMAINRPPTGGDLTFSWKKRPHMSGCVLLALQCPAVRCSARDAVSALQRCSCVRAHRPRALRLPLEALGMAHAKDGPGSRTGPSRLAVGFACSARLFGQNCSKTPNMGWIVDWRGWEGPEVPGMEVRFFPMAARSTVRGSQLEED